MNFSDEQKPVDTVADGGTPRSAFIVMLAASVLTLAATFLLTAIPSLDVTLKTAIFACIVVSYLGFSVVFYYFQGRRGSRRRRPAGQSTAPPARDGDAEETPVPAVGPAAAESAVFSPEIHEKLLVLEQANSFFSTSLKPADMFRLVSNRVAEIIPYGSCALYIADENKTKLKAVQSAGEAAGQFLGLEVDVHAENSIVAKAFSNRRAQLGEGLPPAAGTSTPEGGTRAAVAVPLCDRDFEPYGVLALFDGEKTFDEKTSQLLQAVSVRVAPLFLNSLAFERSLENALTDSLTGLANQRAFFLVLENQIAESQRFGEQRPLTVLAIDVIDFDELNRGYGHATGDKILNLTAKIIKGQLRQMDFLARAGGDEFLAVLPTASEEITKVIVERIEKAFRQNPLDVDGKEKIHVRLNFGSASFLRDGETAQDLLKTAILKKHESKTDGSSGSIIWFPREYVN